VNILPTKLSALASVRSGGGAPQDPAAFTLTGHPFVRAGSLSKLLDGADENSLEKIEPNVAEKNGLQLFPEGTVLFAKSGMSATKGHIHRLRQPAYVVNHLAALVTHEPRDCAFLLRALQRFSPTALIKDPAYPSIRLGDIEEMEILAPDEPVERWRIADILDRADALRTEGREALVQLDTLTRSIFLDMFGDPIANPRGWPRKPIGKIGKVITGNTPPREVADYYGSAIEWIKSDNINTPSHYLTRAVEGLSESGKAVGRIAPRGSILVTCIAGSPDCIGNAAIADRDVAFNQQINAIVPSDGDTEFLYAQILVGKHLIQSASTASMKGMVSKSRFEEVLMIFPPIPLQREFGRQFEAVDKLARVQFASLAELDALFASLQSRAFRGTL